MARFIPNADIRRHHAHGAGQRLSLAIDPPALPASEILDRHHVPRRLRTVATGSAYSLVIRQQKNSDADESFARLMEAANLTGAVTNLSRVKSDYSGRLC
jgi:hypothetical protein